MAERKLTITIVGDPASGKQALDAVGASAGTLEAKVGGLEGTFAKVSQVAGGFLLGTAVQKGPDLLLGLSSSAASLELQLKKASTVFGDQIGVVEEWAAANASSMGLTRNQATTLAAGLADLLVPMGMTREEAALLSTKTVGLAGALSEWSGGTKSAAEVSDILTKAYLGETDGLKALGIAISAADIQSRLAEKGQKDLTGAALQQAQALAIQELIFEKSTDAQAAFANGSGSAARQQAEMTAKANEAKEAMAQGLGPAVTAVSALLATAAIPAFEAVGTAVGFLSRHADVVAATVAAAGAGIVAVLVPAFIAWAAAAIPAAVATVAATAPLLAIGIAVGAAVAAIVLLVAHWDDVTERVPALGHAAERVTAAFREFSDWAREEVIPVVRAIGQAVVDAVSVVVAVVSTHWDTISTLLRVPMEQARAAIDLAWRQIATVVETQIRVIQGIIQTVTALIRGDWSGAWDGIKATVGAAFEGIVSLVRNQLTFIVDSLLKPAYAAMNALTGGALDEMAGRFVDNWKAITATFTAGWATISAWLTASWSLLADLLTAPVDAASSAIAGLVDGIVAVFQDIPARLLALTGEGGELWSAGFAVGSSLFQGLKTALSDTAQFAGDVARAVFEEVRSVVNTRVIEPINRALEFTIPVPGLPDIHVNPPDIPYLGRGGVVIAGDNPSGIEAVVPLERAAEFGFGRGSAAVGQPFEQHVHFHGFVGDVDELLRQLDLAAKRSGRAGILA